MTQVLIAEDDPVQRRILERWLSDWGYTPVLARDGAAALEALEDCRLELAIVDWFLPDLIGPEICRRVRNRPSLPYIILLTTNDDPEAATTALEAGASDFIRKPCRPNELQARLRSGERMAGIQHRLASAHKLEAVGQLAAGLAHEVNTPIQYVTDNLEFLRDGFDDLLSVLGQWKQRCAELPPESREPFRSLLENTEVDYLANEIPNALREGREGLERVASIIRGLRSFAGSEGAEGSGTAEVNEVVRNAVELAGASRQDSVKVELELAEGDPKLEMPGTDLGQVVFNLTVNAVQASADRRALEARFNGESPSESLPRGRVLVRTLRRDGQIVIQVEDDGPGIPPEIRERVFDPFFTTRAVGEGTGQGLTLARKITVERLRGSLDFQTEVGKGTRFELRIPGNAEGVDRDAREVA